jgi:hypothetical protein
MASLRSRPVRCLPPLQTALLAALVLLVVDAPWVTGVPPHPRSEQRSIRYAPGALERFSRDIEKNVKSGHGLRREMVDEDIIIDAEHKSRVCKRDKRRGQLYAI